MSGPVARRATLPGRIRARTAPQCGYYWEIVTGYTGGGGLDSSTGRRQVSRKLDTGNGGGGGFVSGSLVASRVLGLVRLSVFAAIWGGTQALND